MLKKFSRTTNFILIGIVVGLFVGVSIRQVLGDTTTVPGTVRADNLTVGTSGLYENGLIVASGNALVAGDIGVGTTTPRTSLDVVGTITASASICIGTGADITCITRDQLQALLAGGGAGTGTGTGTGTTSAGDATLCNSLMGSVSGGGTVDGVKPFICSGKRVRSAMNEYLDDGAGGIPGYYYLPYLHKTDHDECFVTSPLPLSLTVTTTPNGCRLNGVVRESGRFNWTVRNEFGSSTGDFTVESFVPDMTLGFYSVCSGNNCKLCDDAKIGEPFSCTLRVGTTGDWTGKKITWNVSGLPAGLIFDAAAEVITGPDPSEDDTSTTITGIPTEAGTYRVGFCAGSGTEAHTSFCLAPPFLFVVKP